MGKFQQNEVKAPAPQSLYLPALDGLRFLAFLLVFVHHAPNLKKSSVLSSINTYGWVGVELFFVISAFLFFHLFKSEHAKTGRIDIGRFYVRRLLRIYPLMVAFPALMLVIFWDQAPAGSVLRLLGIATFSDNFLAWIKSYNRIPFSSPLWSLSYEFQIYLVIPFAFMALRRLGAKRFIMVAGGLFFFCLALRLIFTGVGARHPLVWVTPFLHPDAVLIGLVLPLGLAARVPLWACGLLFCSATYSFFNSPLPWTGSHGAAITYPIGALACATLVVLALRWSVLRKALSWAPIVFLGSISFGLYVYHVLGLYLAGKLLTSLNLEVTPTTNIRQWLVFTLTGLMLTMIMATLSFYLFEKPLLRLKDRFAIVHGRALQ